MSGFRRIISPNDRRPSRLAGPSSPPYRCCSSSSSSCSPASESRPAMHLFPPFLCRLAFSTPFHAPLLQPHLCHPTFTLLPTFSISPSPPHRWQHAIAAPTCHPTFPAPSPAHVCGPPLATPRLPPHRLDPVLATCTVWISPIRTNDTLGRPTSSSQADEYVNRFP
jgi:hypothetical protein